MEYTLKGSPWNSDKLSATKQQNLLRSTLKIWLLADASKPFNGSFLNKSYHLFQLNSKKFSIFNNFIYHKKGKVEFITPVMFRGLSPRWILTGLCNKRNNLPWNKFLPQFRTSKCHKRQETCVTQVKLTPAHNES